MNGIGEGIAFTGACIAVALIEINGGSAVVIGMGLTIWAITTDWGKPKSFNIKTGERMKNEIDIDALEALADAASSGEWIVQHPNAGERGHEVANCAGLNQISADVKEQDARFIAAANPLAVKQLIALLRAADEARKSAQEQLENEIEKRNRDKLLRERDNLTRRAEAAEAELKALREQEPIINRIAKRKLDELIAKGWQINGYAITKEGRHGMVTNGGRVLWWFENMPEKK